MSGVVKPGAFRDAFAFASKDVTHYFPRHMSKGLIQMQKTLKHVDCIIEVHDARIPLSGRNPLFQNTMLIKPHLLLLNKMDLADLSHKELLEQKLLEQGVNKVLFANCKSGKSSAIKNKIIPAVVELIENSSRYNRENEKDYNALILGIPNVGKSSLINALRSTHLKRRKATPVGAVAGITKSILEKIKVYENPRLYVFDSPGILDPSVVEMEVGMKLAACANLQDHMVGPHIIADYLLYWLNKNGIFKYVEHFNLPAPTDNIAQLLIYIAKERNMGQKRKIITGTGQEYMHLPNFQHTANLFIRAFREGNLGLVNLDMNILQEEQEYAESVT